MPRPPRRRSAPPPPLITSLPAEPLSRSGPPRPAGGRPRSGEDVIGGRARADVVAAATGADQVAIRPGDDAVVAAEGDDHVRSRGAEQLVVSGGPVRSPATPRQVAAARTRVEAVALLLPLTGSFWSPLTVAVLRIVPASRGTTDDRHRRLGAAVVDPDRVEAADVAGDLPSCTRRLRRARSPRPGRRFSAGCRSPSPRSPARARGFRRRWRRSSSSRPARDRGCRTW